MLKSIVIGIAVFIASCNRPTYYIVRHAEKAAQAQNMTSDVILTEAGDERAKALENKLRNKRIGHIFSTNTIRTISTAKPLSDATGIKIKFYDTRDTSFISELRKIQKGGVVVVGHSNTVDDLVNKLMASPVLKDLPDTTYGDLFIVKRKRTKYTFAKSYFGN